MAGTVVGAGTAEAEGGTAEAEETARALDMEVILRVGGGRKPDIAMRRGMEGRKGEWKTAGQGAVGARKFERPRKLVEFERENCLAYHTKALKGEDEDDAR